MAQRHSKPRSSAMQIPRKVSVYVSYSAYTQKPADGRAEGGGPWVSPYEHGPIKMVLRRVKPSLGTLPSFSMDPETSHATVDRAGRTFLASSSAIPVVYPLPVDVEKLDVSQSYYSALGVSMTASLLRPTTRYLSCTSITHRPSRSV